LPACCCQPAVAGGIIYADLRGELSTHLALQALFAQSSPVREPLLQAFHFPSTLGKVTLHPRSQACVFIYSSCGKWVFPRLLCIFLPPPLLQAFPHLITGRVLLLLVHIFPSRLGTGVVWRQPGGALLISPFNVKWRRSAQAGGMEGSKFCLFPVTLPARCVSSVSSRFHFRRHTFCFLPLATILESLKLIFMRCETYLRVHFLHMNFLLYHLC
jgi:hypothetical protein